MAYNSSTSAQHVQQWLNHAPVPSAEMLLLHHAFTEATRLLESRPSRANSQVLNQWISYRIHARDQIFRHFVQYVGETGWNMLGETGSTERQESVNQLRSIELVALYTALARHNANVEAQIGRNSPPAPNPLDSPPILSAGPANQSNESLPNEDGSTRPRSAHSQGSDEMFVMEK